mmetsp:Transcript_4483/g.7330  ORF Transcript_4483/g.7330 Transcript_4483/m.7330 type:complete len:446 (+) Transcript_4483:69-1406(+)
MSSFLDTMETNLTSSDWLSSVVGFPVSSLKIESASGEGGLSGGLMRRLIVTTSEGVEKKYVVKSIREERLEMSSDLGLAREALLYKELGHSFSVGLPHVVFAEGDMATGSKYLIMEDLSDAVQTGYFFGPGSPLNWNKDLHAQMNRIPDATLEEILTEAMKVAGQFHGIFWMQETLLEKSWLHGVEWMRGENEESWKAGQLVGSSAWEKTKSKISKASETGYTVRWSDYTVSLLEASIGKSSWLEDQARIQNVPWTLVHGDFHPANMMWRPSAVASASASADVAPAGQGKQRLVLLDWEAAGVGNGAQDIGQYFISHMAPAQREEHEMKMLRVYYDTLIAHKTSSSSTSSTGDSTNNISRTSASSSSNASSSSSISQAQVHVAAVEYTWEMCVQDYIRGGSERWVWLLCLLSGMCPDPMVQYFHDQFEAFCKHHGVTPASIGMPR